MRKDFRKKTVTTATKIPAYTVSRKKKFDLKKDLPAYILFVLFIFWTIGSIFGILAYQRNKGISASADEYNLDDYPSANLYYPYMTSWMDSGAVIKNRDIDTITVRTYLPGVYRSVFFDIGDIVNVGDTVHLSATWTSSNSNTGCIRIMSYFRDSGVASQDVIISTVSGAVVSGTIDEYPPEATLVLCLYSNWTASSVLNETVTYENVMLNVGDKSYPFIPNLNAVAEQARQDGYLLGEEDGYEQGRIDGLKKGDISFLVGSKAKAIYALNANFEYETAYYESNASGGTVAFDKLYNALPPGTYSYLNVTVDFASPVFGRNLYLNAYGNRGIFYDGDTPKVFTAITQDGQRLNARFVYNESEDNYGLELQISSFDFYLVRLEAIPVATRSNLDTFSLRVPNSSYREGYNDGYNVGVKDNTTLMEQYELGLSQGFSQGKVIGYNEGIEDANTYTFTNLLGSVFDVPIKAFNGLLNFEVLGVNLRGFYLSLLTACLVLVIIRLFI